MKQPFACAIVVLAAVILLCAPGVAQTGATHYIAASGLDSNTGLSTAAPWAHMPGMATCTANCAAYQPAAGDRFIFRGGDTWNNSNFPDRWSWSGAADNPIYIGVSPTWYAGSAWARPVFNAGGAVLGPSNQFINFSSGLSYVVIDNIEFTGFYWSGNNIPWGNAVMIGLSTATNVTVENCYFHNWSHDYPGSCNNTCDDMIVILGNANSPYNAGVVVQNNVADGSPNGTDSGKFTYNIPNQYFNIVGNMTNGIMYTVNSSVHDNYIHNINASYDPGLHENFMECAPCGGTNYIYNNVATVGIGESLFAGGGAGEVDYIWNNLWYRIAGNPPHIEARNSSWSGYYFNNTVVPAAGGNCFLEVGSNTIAITLENNHCISTAPITNGTSGFTLVTNVTQTPTAAAGQGYTSSEAFPYSPTTVSAATVAAGSNLSPMCSGNVAALCSDITYACTLTSSNAVSCPARQSLARPATGAWDAGAYAFTVVNPPNPPTDLTATAN